MGVKLCNANASSLNSSWAFTQSTTQKLFAVQTIACFCALFVTRSAADPTTIATLLNWEKTEQAVVNKAGRWLIESVSFGEGHLCLALGQRNWPAPVSSDIHGRNCEARQAMVFGSVKSSTQIELSTCFLRFFISDSIARWDANRFRLDCALSAI